MNITFENILLIGSVLLGISVLVGKTSFRLGVPTLILFVIVGMLAGSEGFGGCLFSNWFMRASIQGINLNCLISEL